jgi:predicted RNase H-like nuclease
MRKYSSDKDIHKLICRLVKNDWQYQRRKKHGLLTSPEGNHVMVPGSPSDKRAYTNFSKEIQRTV